MSASVEGIEKTRMTLAMNGVRQQESPRQQRTSAVGDAENISTALYDFTVRSRRTARPAGGPGTGVCR
jgi:hypothetical protein